MKKLSVSVIFLAAFLVTTVFAAVTVKTNRGVVYENAEVTSVEKGAVMLKHSGGVAKVPLRELSKEARRSLGVKPTLETAKGDFNQQLKVFKKSLFDLDVSYAGHLGDLEKKAQTAGLLDQVLEVRKELKEFRTEGRAEYKYDKLKKMRAIYEGERMKRRNRIVDELKVALGQYQIELKGIQKALTMENKVDEAILAKKEEERVVAMLMNRKQALDDLGVFSVAAVAPVEKSDKVAMEKARASSRSGGIASTVIASATKDKPFENSLAMRFVPVPITGGESEGENILFSIWETRVEDYQAFIKKNRGRTWEKPDFPQKDDHPVVEVKWADAEAFCIWLTAKEQAEGILGSNQKYRLPSDHEWSCAVGIAEKEDAEMSPSLKKFRNMEVYPWGEGFPPPVKAGNFYGEECKKNPFQNGRVPIAGYNDGFDRTAPAGSFESNKFGIYDLGGNVSEWCQGWYDTTNKVNKVRRGGAWYLSKTTDLMSASRAGGTQGFSTPGLGFRIVLDMGRGDE